MPKKEEGKRFSCLKCGSSYVAYPPDDLHTVASLKEDGVVEPVKMTYRCQGCGNENIICWGYRKMHIAVGRF